MAYYTKADEPPGQWYGKGAAKLGLTGQVDPQVIDRLFMDNIGPDGQVMANRRRQGGELAAADKAVKLYVRARPFASSVEVQEVRSRERAKAAPKSVPYFDLTVSAVKSVSVLHASYRVAAMQARARGADDEADKFDARAHAIERALMDAARDAVDWMEMHACYTRTGYHSSTTGEWRDGDGLTTSLFLHHLSRDGDPQLHVHVAIWNRTQRADGADDKWRTLFGRSLYSQGPGCRLGVAPVPDRFLEARLAAMGLVMVPREDGNGCEVGGVDPAVMQRFSSRSVSIGPELAQLAAGYERLHGKPPSRRTLWLLHQQAGQNTRRTKAEARRTVGGQVGMKELSLAERLAAWEEQTTTAEMRALSAVCAQAEQFARDHAPGGAPDGADLPGPVPGRVLDDAAKRRAARVAVAEVQKHHSAWGMAELRFEVHRALGAGVSSSDVTEVAELAISGRCGTGVVQIGAAPDITDVDALGVRASDGVSVYRPPGQELWCTLDHLDLEEHIVNRAKVKVGRRVNVAEAKAAVAGTDLTAPQADAVVAMLTADTMTIPLNAAAGSGKSHAMAVFSRLWTRFTGGRVIGLTTSTNAAYVLSNEGLAESYNIAQFLGKVKDSDELRRPVRVNPGDVLVVDEATQVSTADFALLQQAARAAGAQLHPVGDTRQLGAVEAGGIFSLLVTELGGPEMAEVLRFRHQWEAEASMRLLEGDIGVHAIYDRRGRIHGGDHEAIFDAAARAYLSDLLRGRDALLLAGSSDEASDLARRVQARLVQMGRAQPGQIELSDGNFAGEGDLIRARLNVHIDAGGRRLTNRDTLRVTAIGEDQLTAQRRIGPGTWSAPFPVPFGYVTANAELDYAGNVHVSQGRTVDVSHSVVTHTMSRRSLGVGMTRGREENHAHVETGTTAPPGKPAYEQATVESALKAVMEREAEELSATEQMRAAQDWAVGSGHVLHLWSVAVRESLYPEIDRRVMARLTPDQAWRYEREYSRKAFHARMREAQLAGHDLGELIDRVTADSLDGARSVSSVLHSRLAGLGLDVQHNPTWAQRTRAGAPQIARELAEGLDARTSELGQRHAAQTQPWLAKRLGVLAPDASPALRAEYERRAGIAAAYREAAGITDPEQAIATEPHEGNRNWRRGGERPCRPWRSATKPSTYGACPGRSWRRRSRRGTGRWPRHRPTSLGSCGPQRRPRLPRGRSTSTLELGRPTPKRAVRRTWPPCMPRPRRHWSRGWPLTSGGRPRPPPSGTRRARPALSWGAGRRRPQT
jgi:conjugative relaxase-like TrwC/TraI family protein